MKQKKNKNKKNNNIKNNINNNINDLQNNNQNNFLDIIWIDEKVNNKENSEYFNNLKTLYPKIKINHLYDSLEEGFNYIKNLNFETVFIIVSGKLYPKYYKMLNENLFYLKCIPITIIFTSSKFKKILLGEEPDKNKRVSYDVKMSLNHPFYNPGGVLALYDDVEKFLKNFNENFKHSEISGTSIDLNYEGLFTFEYIETINDLFAPSVYKDILTMKNLTEEEITLFNNYLLSYNNNDLNNLITPINYVKQIPKEIISKYWARAYTLVSNFYKEMNCKLMDSNLELYNIYIRLLYKGLELKALKTNYSNKLYRGTRINKEEIKKLKKHLKQKKVIVFCKAFLSFSKKEEKTYHFLKDDTDCKSSTFFELNELNNYEKDNYNISNIELKDFSAYQYEEEVLFLPGSSFEIIKIESDVIINEKKRVKITLKYLGKFKQEFNNIYNDYNIITELISKSSLTKNIFMLNETSNNLDSLELTNKIKFLKGGIYFLKHRIDVDKYIVKNRYDNKEYICIFYDKEEVSKEEFEKNLKFSQIMSQLPYSIKNIENFEDDENYYLINNLYDETLEGFMHKYDKPLPVNLIHKILMQLNVCLKKLLDLRCVHRDIKPENIYINYINEEKTNFDIQLGGYNFSKQNKSSSRCSSVVGTQNYIAPEIDQGKDSNKCDLWSIGIMIYYFYFYKIPNIIKLYQESKIDEKVDDDDIRDLLSKLLIVDPHKRINWDDYFCHPFFKKY